MVWKVGHELVVGLQGSFVFFFNIRRLIGAKSFLLTFLTGLQFFKSFMIVQRLQYRLLLCPLEDLTGHWPLVTQNMTCERTGFD